MYSMFTIVLIILLRHWTHKPSATELSKVFEFEPAQQLVLFAVITDNTIQTRIDYRSNQAPQLPYSLASSGS